MRMKMLFSKSSIDYGKTKEEIWASLDLKDDVSSDEPKKMSHLSNVLACSGHDRFYVWFGPISSLL